MNIVQITDNYYIISIAIIIISFSTAKYIFPIKRGIGRSSFIIILGFIYASNSIKDLLIIQYLENKKYLIDGGWLLFDAILTIIFGTVLGITVGYRCIDIWEKDSNRFIALIPFVNLLLFFKKSAIPTKNSISSWIISIIKTIIGLFLISISIVINNEISNRQELNLDSKILYTKNENNRSAYINELDYQMESLRKKLPIKLDDITYMTEITHTTNGYRYIYEVRNVKEIPNYTKIKLLDFYCDKDYRIIIDNGITFDFAYYDSNGKLIGIFKIQKDSCPLK